MDRKILHPFSGVRCLVLWSDVALMYMKRRRFAGVSPAQALHEGRAFAEDRAIRRMTPTWVNGHCYLNGQEITL